MNFQFDRTLFDASRADRGLINARSRVSLRIFLRRVDGPSIGSSLPRSQTFEGQLPKRVACARLRITLLVSEDPQFRQKSRRSSVTPSIGFTMNTHRVRIRKGALFFGAQSAREPGTLANA